MSAFMTDEEIAAEQHLMLQQQAGVQPPPPLSDRDAASVTPFDLLSSSNYTDRGTRDGRYAACKDCDRLIGLTKQCRECMCVMPAKTWLKDATCPIGKWGAV